MKKLFFVVICSTCLMVQSCDSNSPNSTDSTSQETEKMSGQSGVQDDVSQKTVVQIAIGSKDHSTLVAAVKAAELVDVVPCKYFATKWNR